MTQCDDLSWLIHTEGHAVFIRIKTNGPHEYLQVVTNERIKGKVRQ